MLRPQTACQRQVTEKNLGGFFNEMLPSYSYGECLMHSNSPNNPKIIPNTF